MRSLFVVSLPCSLSTLTYHAARLALGLDEPVWTTDGELLNADRFALTPPAWEGGLKYVRRSDDEAAFARVLAFLDQATVPHGFAYKDVVHPFVAAEYLRRSPFRILRIERPLADVASSMLGRGWLYPGNAADGAADEGAALLDGLAQAERALRELPAVTVAYDDLVTDESVLRAALGKLYPERAIPGIGYIDEDFVKHREKILRRRETEGYLRLVHQLEQLHHDKEIAT